MKKTKSNYKIVPFAHPSLGACWQLKRVDSVIGTFVKYDQAERRKNELDKAELEMFLLTSTKNQELQISE